MYYITLVFKKKKKKNIYLKKNKEKINNIELKKTYM